MILGIGIRASLAAEEPSLGVPVLLYHRFEASAPGLTTIRPEVLAEQLEWLKSHHVAVLPLHHVLDSIIGNASAIDVPAVVLAADDGHRSIYDKMYPLLRRYGVHATLFIYPSAISNAEDALTWEQLDEMVKSGLIDVQSHTYWHPNFQTEKQRLTPTAYRDFVRFQFNRSKSRLETRLGIKVDLLAWPFGLSDPELEQDARAAGYVAAFTIERKPLRPGQNPYALPRFIVTDADHGSRFAALINGAIGREVAP
jgi:peptidoglycan/xylan/chitin deacetylase (PgdA/CDA1 family)